ncbi:hypothetical protein ASPZODRAFT_18673 [Penicilliopsis zonata CBS 506.65]|uniref:Major facilitator superfamily (MFS) profile domain-containing protein n=1 Tax=Penicilliopsis zonata CBS 506.65 TaxID=1073090 RepID=A0A1L9SBC6_9EURO|nr:hypothetical protein ASPZODRAFT_18673 [Penicilliopsis zonata CBS 506.65]OJJ44483.1 hypothetical protein ASPZODRAFT_18673 [Penicilliopsis zonata CBS 506.65]
MAQNKPNTENIESIEMDPPDTQLKAPIMRTKEDDLGVWQSVKRYKWVSVLAMVAAFSASLDGYQINLNGGIVANKGFIRQMAAPGTTIINSNYVSAWGGIQSAGQTIGQILLQFATERLGRKVAFYILSIFLVASIFAESFATAWDHWLVAKLLSGMGVGMLQATLPFYISEIAPTQLRGFLINAYTFWFVLGQLFASLALNRLNAQDPYDFRTAIYTQWAMVGISIVIIIMIPESPWWLVSKDRQPQAAKILHTFYGHVEGYDIQQTIDAMTATVAEERRLARENSQQGIWAIFRGRNGVRFLIAAWPKITQQFVGLSVFNTYATYFFQYAGSNNPFLVTLILSCTQIISMIFTSSMTDKLGRRPLTVYPYAVTVVSVLCLGIIGCFDYTEKATSSLLIFFACLATFSTTGASAIGYAYAAEVPRQAQRAQTAGWSLASSNFLSIMFSFCTPLMINGNAQWGVKTGFFFAATGSIAVVVAWFILPEVALRTPAEIDELFEKRVNFRKFKGYVTDVEINARAGYVDS